MDPFPLLFEVEELALVINEEENQRHEEKYFYAQVK